MFTEKKLLPKYLPSIDSIFFSLGKESERERALEKSGKIEQGISSTDKSFSVDQISNETTTI